MIGSRLVDALRRTVLPAGSRRERGAWRAYLALTQAWHAARARSFAVPRARVAGIRSPSEVAGLVSVVLPVYQQADLLGTSVASVLGQTHRALELIVVDDGSTDDVTGALAPFAGDSRLRLLRQPNLKLPRALSHGFMFASGEYWTWTSADNVMEPTQLQTLVAYLDAHTDVAMVYADYRLIDDAGAPLADPAFRSIDRHPRGSPDVHLPRDVDALATARDNFIGPCFLYRGVAGRALGAYADCLGMEDFDYWLRMHHAFRIAHLGRDDVLYRYRVHANSLTGRGAELRLRERAARLRSAERARCAAFRGDTRRTVASRFDPPIEGRELRAASRTPFCIVTDPRSGATLEVVNPDTFVVDDPAGGDAFVAVAARDRAHRPRTATVALPIPDGSLAPRTIRVVEPAIAPLRRRGLAAAVIRDLEAVPGCRAIGEGDDALPTVPVDLTVGCGCVPPDASAVRALVVPTSASWRRIAAALPGRLDACFVATRAAAAAVLVDRRIDPRTVVLVDPDSLPHPTRAGDRSLACALAWLANGGPAAATRAWLLRDARHASADSARDDRVTGRYAAPRPQ